MLVSSRRILGAVLGIAAVLSALPQSAQAPWSAGLAAAVRAPLSPAVSGLAWVRDRVRAPDDPYPNLPEELRDAREDRDRLRGELDAAQLRVGQLERELGELSGYRPGERAGWRPRLASVVERGGGRPAGLLGIDVGSAQGVSQGDPVVVGGNQLVGVVAAGGDASHSWVIPVDDRRAGRIDAVLHPSGSAGLGPAGARTGNAPGSTGPRPTVLVQLVPQGGRTLVGELETGPDGRAADVRPGDSVLLSDATWRPAAQGMRIGLVESVGALDSNPLRRRITVRMEADPARLGRVVVKVQDAAGEGGSR